MISFRSTEDETAFVDVAKGFAKDEIRPVARECEENCVVHSNIARKAEGLGFAGLELPESWAGLEMPLISQVQMLQALCYGDLGVVQGLSGAGDAASLIRLASENTTFDSYKNAGRDGSWPNAAFLDATDPDAPWAEELEVAQDGGGYRLSGVSQPVRMVAFAEYLAVVAVDSQGESVVLWLDNQTHAWKVREGDYRLGLLAAGLSRLHFHDVKVEATQVLAKGQDAKDLISQAQSRIRVLQAAKEVGLMEAALDYATEYTAGRKAFGQEIAKFQGVSFKIAEMAIETRIANHLIWQAATQIDEEAADAVGTSLRALYRAHRSVRFVTDSAVQLLGGHGFVNEFPVEKWMRDAQAQVGLYGREKDLLARRGEQIVNGTKEGVTQ